MDYVHNFDRILLQVIMCNAIEVLIGCSKLKSYTITDTILFRAHDKACMTLTKYLWFEK